MRKKVNIYVALIVSIVSITTSTVILGEAFTHEFNILLDAGILERFFFTFQKPLIFSLVLVMQIILFFFIYLRVRPLMLYIRHPEKTEYYQKSRRATLSIPWFIIAITGEIGRASCRERV